MDVVEVGGDCWRWGCLRGLVEVVTVGWRVEVVVEEEEQQQRQQDEEQ